MTVVELDGAGAHCVWMVGSQPQTAWFSFACLVKAENRRWFRRADSGAMVDDLARRFGASRSASDA